MSLSEILDDISSEVTGIGDLPIVEGVPNNNHKLETNTPLFPEELPALNKEALESIQIQQELLSIKSIVKDAVKVDRSIVLEAMAALPVTDKVMEAKLTTAPSTINKRILDDIIYEGTDKVPEEWITCVRELYEEVTTREEILNTIVSDVEGRREIIASLIVSKGLENKELTLASSGGYEGWSKTLKTFSSFKELLNLEDGIWTITGQGLLDVVDDLKLYIKSHVRNIIAFKEAASVYLERNPTKITEELNNVVDCIKSCYFGMESFNFVAGLVKGEDCPMAFIIKDLEAM